MKIDPENTVVRLCAEGIQAEMEGNITMASSCYLRAWDLHETNLEACIVAHYLARIQETHEDMLRWNLQALAYADKVQDETVSAFYPSLYLNIGKSWEDLGNPSEAKKYYELGAGKSDMLPDDPLGNITRDALKRGLERTHTHER